MYRIPRSRGVDSGTSGSPLGVVVGIPRSRGVDSLEASLVRDAEAGIPRSRGVDSALTVSSYTEPAVFPAHAGLILFSLGL